MSCVIYFDGGTYKSNPGPIETGFVVMRDSLEFYREQHEFLGTSNMAEWSTFLLGLYYAKHQGIRSVKMIGDSQLVVNQAALKWRVKNKNLIPLFEEYVSVRNDFKSIQTEWIKRDQNIAGVFLEHGEQKARQLIR